MARPEPSAPQEHGIRRARRADSPAVTEVYLCSRRHAGPAIPPLVHGDEDVRQWVAEVVFEEHEVWMAEDATMAIAMLVLGAASIEHLYVRPGHTGRGVGSRLVDVAKQRRPAGLDLWTFATNTGAQRFYERHGFVAAERTDGSANEERSPDIRYVWRPRGSPARKDGGHG